MMVSAWKVPAKGESLQPLKCIVDNGVIYLEDGLGAKATNKKFTGRNFSTDSAKFLHCKTIKTSTSR